jgi:hypothetical protein
MEKALDGRESVMRDHEGIKKMAKPPIEQAL